MVRYPGLQRKAGLASLERSVGEMGMLLRCSACEVMFQKVRANAHVEWVGLRLSLRISTESRGLVMPARPTMWLFSHLDLTNVCPGGQRVGVGRKALLGMLVTVSGCI